MTPGQERGQLGQSDIQRWCINLSNLTLISRDHMRIALFLLPSLSESQVRTLPRRAKG